MREPPGPERRAHGPGGPPGRCRTPVL